MEWWIGGFLTWIAFGYCAFGLFKGMEIANHRFTCRMAVHDDSYCFEREFDYRNRNAAVLMLMLGPVLFTLMFILWSMSQFQSFRFWNPFSIFKQA